MKHPHVVIVGDGIGALSVLFSLQKGYSANIIDITFVTPRHISPLFRVMCEPSQQQHQQSTVEVVNSKLKLHCTRCVVGHPHFISTVTKTVYFGEESIAFDYLVVAHSPLDCMPSSFQEKRLQLTVPSLTVPWASSYLLHLFDDYDYAQFARLLSEAGVVREQVDVTALQPKPVIDGLPPADDSDSELSDDERMVMIERATNVAIVIPPPSKASNAFSTYIAKCCIAAGAGVEAVLWPFAFSLAYPGESSADVSQLCPGEHGVVKLELLAEVYAKVCVRGDGPQHLLLRDNGFAGAAVPHITSLLFNPYLQTLDLSGNALVAEDVSSILKSAAQSAFQQTSNLQSLSFARNRVDGTLEKEALTAFFQHHPWVKAVDFSGNPLGESGAAAVLVAAELSNSLLSLKLDSVDLPDGTELLCPALAQLLQSTRTKLEILSLSNNRLGKNACKVIGTCLANNSPLLQLVAEGNADIPAVGIQFLVESCMANTTLKKLHVAHTAPLTLKELTRLATLFEANAHLESVTVSVQPEKRLAAQVLAEGLRNNTSVVDLRVFAGHDLLPPVEKVVKNAESVPRPPSEASPVLSPYDAIVKIPALCAGKQRMQLHICVYDEILKVLPAALHTGAAQFFVAKLKSVFNGSALFTPVIASPGKDAKIDILSRYSHPMVPALWNCSGLHKRDGNLNSVELLHVGERNNVLAGATTGGGEPCIFAVGPYVHHPQFSFSALQFYDPSCWEAISRQCIAIGSSIMKSFFRAEKASSAVKEKDVACTEPPKVLLASLRNAAHLQPKTPSSVAAQLAKEISWGAKESGTTALQLLQTYQIARVIEEALRQIDLVRPAAYADVTKLSEEELARLMEQRAKDKEEEQRRQKEEAEKREKERQKEERERKAAAKKKGGPAGKKEEEAPAKAAEIANANDSVTGPNTGAADGGNVPNLGAVLQAFEQQQYEPPKDVLDLLVGVLQTMQSNGSVRPKPIVL